MPAALDALVKDAQHKGAKPHPVASAKAAGLRYVVDDGPGIRRVAAGTARTGGAGGKSFKYVTPQGKAVKDPDALARIRALAIPPAWTDVWISPVENGHLQATGRDARGRKQYRYHAKWRATRDETKYHRMIAFARALPAIRKRVEADIGRPHLSREKVLAAVVRLLGSTLIRVGNDEYAKSNASFGLTTMRDHHVEVSGQTITFRFKGKSGIAHEIDLDSPRLAKIVRQCRDLPGQELFQYRDEAGKVRDVGSQDVNEYLKEISGQDFTAKDFRTWAGTVLAAMALQEVEDYDSNAGMKRNVKRAIESVAARLGNTVAVCRKCYVHPAIIDSYLDHTLLETLKKRTEKTLRGRALAGLRPEEAAVLGLLQQRLEAETKSGRGGAVVKKPARRAA